ncbi:MAG: ATP-binding protein [Chitinophagales bacterium]
MDGDITEQRTNHRFCIDGAAAQNNLIRDYYAPQSGDANHAQRRLLDIVDEIRLNLDVLLNDKNAIIISSDLPDIMADRTMILQLFQNIIGNGIKYNENKRPLVKVKGCLRANEIELTFADNGIGIPEHFREKVEIFKRLHTTQEYSGSGIGLSICRKIAESMNGRITIEDNPTGGTVFKVNLPISLIA